MKAAIATGLGAVLVQSQAFEPTDFNATQALIENGVDVSNLSLVDSLSEESGLSACSGAVSVHFFLCFFFFTVFEVDQVSLLKPDVFFFEHDFFFQSSFRFTTRCFTKHQHLSSRHTMTQRFSWPPSPAPTDSSSALGSV